MQLGMKIGRSSAADDDVRTDPSKLIIRLGALLEPIVDPQDPRDGKGSLLAWDPVAQKLRWRVDYPSFLNAGTMTTAGSLVFQGTNEGKFYAYDARSGKRLWSFDAKLGILGPPISYAANARQYVSILVGYGAGAGEGGPGMNQGWKYGLQPRRLLTFILDGKARLPDTPPPNFSVSTLDNPKIRLNPARVSRGEIFFVRFACSTCHGGGVEATGGAPDLRESNVAFDRGAFGRILNDAPMLANGMPRFDDLSDSEVEDLYQYIRAQARKYRKEVR